MSRKWRIAEELVRRHVWRSRIHDCSRGTCTEPLRSGSELCSNTIAKTSHYTQSELACLHDFIATKTQRQNWAPFCRCVFLVIARHASCIALLSPRAVDTRSSSTNSSRHMILRAKLATHATSASVLNFYLPRQGGKAINIYHVVYLCDGWLCTLQIPGMLLCQRICLSENYLATNNVARLTKWYCPTPRPC